MSGSATAEPQDERGIDAERLSAVGRGEDSPLAANDTESGRALNRRVQIHRDAAG